MSQKSLLELIETGKFKDGRKQVMLYLKEKPYSEFMNIIHDKTKDESERMAFSTVVDKLIQAILEDRILIMVDDKQKE